MTHLEEIAQAEGIPSGVQIRNSIDAIGWDLEKLTSMCVELRNQALKARHPQQITLKGSGDISWPAYLSEESATAIWLALAEKAGFLSESESKLYEALTEKFTTDASLHFVVTPEAPSHLSGRPVYPGPNPSA